MNMGSNVSRGKYMRKLCRPHIFPEPVKKMRSTWEKNEGNVRKLWKCGEIRENAEKFDCAELCRKKENAGRIILPPHAHPIATYIPPAHLYLALQWYTMPPIKRHKPTTPRWDLPTCRPGRQNSTDGECGRLDSRCGTLCWQQWSRGGICISKVAT